MSASDVIVPVEVTSCRCRACGEERLLTDYREFPMNRELLMDFCIRCEGQYSTLMLYRRYGAYGTQEIIDAVFSADRTPEKRRDELQTRLLVQANTQASQLTREEVVQKELARRELARRRLIMFVTAMKPDYSAGWVHHDICRHLEAFVRDVEDGKSPRLMLFLPPRIGKSELASDQLPSWVLGKHPEWPIIASSYAQSLPLKFSRNIRDRLKDPEYKAIFPDTELRSDATGIEEWLTTKGGGYKAAGIGTGITGFGGKILIVDDPVKDEEEAQSDKIRDNTYGWYQSTFSTRLAPGGGILVIQTRWHFDDLSGRLLADDQKLAAMGVPEHERQNWKVVSYEALAEQDEHLLPDGTVHQGSLVDGLEAIRLLRRRGDALHPERYPTDAMKRLRNSLPSSTWNALYQQKPTPDEGEFFKRQQFIYRWLDPAYRSLCATFMTVDYAISKKARRDYTVMGVFALDADDDLYLIDARRSRMGSIEIAENVLDLVLKHKPQVYAGEQGQIHSAVWPIIDAKLRGARQMISVDDSLTPIQDKEIRARPLQARMQQKKLILSYDTDVKPDVYDAIERELLQFPNGVNDDCVDVLAWAARLAINMPLPSRRAPPKQDSWKDRLHKLQRNTHSHMAG